MPAALSWITTLAAIYGVAWIVAESKISYPLRREVAAALGPESFVLALLECPVCQSFWYGLAAGFFILRLGLWLSLAFSLVAVTSSAVLWNLTLGGEPK